MKKRSKRKATLSQRFFQACERGDLESLVEMVPSILQRLRRERPTLNLPPPRDIDSGEHGYVGLSACTPLHAAACNGHTEVVEFLFREGVFDVGFVDRETPYPPDRVDCASTALYLACFNRHFNTCRALLDAGADPNVGPLSGLDVVNGGAYLAVTRGDTEMLRLFLKYNADPELAWRQRECDYCTCSSFGYLPLDVAIRRIDVEMMRVLLQHGCYMLCEHEGPQYPILMQMKGDAAERAQIYSVLQEHNRGYLVRSFLRFATSHLNKKAQVVCGELLDSGVVDINDQLEGKTALLMTLGEAYRRRERGQAYPSEAKAMWQFLIDRGADPFCGGLFDRHFHIVLELHDRPELLLWLLKCWKERYQSRNEEGDSPIHIACRHQQTHYKSIEMLIQDDDSSLDFADQKLGLLPVQLASLNGLDINVIFTLLMARPNLVTTLEQQQSILP